LFYDRISRGYDLIADASEHAVRERGIRALGLSDGQRVLEIGYGTGHGLLSLADAVGKTGQVHGVDISAGMTVVARARIRAAGVRNVTLTVGDASLLCFRPSVFDAVFMSFTLELFESAVPDVLAEVRRVLRDGGRLGVVAMAATGETNPMIDLYQWAHRHCPHLVDCRPIDVASVLQAARFQTETAAASAIWTLPSRRRHRSQGDGWLARRSDHVIDSPSQTAARSPATLDLDPIRDFMRLLWSVEHGLQSASKRMEGRSRHHGSAARRRSCARCEDRPSKKSSTQMTSADPGPLTIGRVTRVYPRPSPASPLSNQPANARTS